MALRAFTLHKTAGEEHAAVFAVELGHCATRNVTLFVQAQIDTLRQLAVLFAVGRTVLIKAHFKGAELLHAGFVAACDQGFRRNPFLASTDHNRRAVRVICTHIDALVAHHLLVTHPEVGLKIFHQVTQMQGTIGIRQSTRYNNFTGIHRDLFHPEGAYCANV